MTVIQPTHVQVLPVSKCSRMKVLITVLLTVLCIEYQQCQLLNLASPYYWMQKITSQFQPKKIVIVVTTTTPAPLLLSSEEILFSIGPTLQVDLDPDDMSAKTNYFVSPLSAAVMFCNMLLAADGLNYNYLVRLIKMKGKDTNKMHLDFLLNVNHWLKAITMTTPTSTVIEKGAFMFQNDAELSDHFLANTIRFFQTDIVGAHFDDPSDSLDKVTKWIDRFNLDNSTGHLNNVLKDNTQSILLNVFQFETKWQGDYLKMTRQDFSVKPFKKVKTTFFKATVSAYYLDNSKYTLAGLPDISAKHTLFMILPKGSDWIKYEIREFSENFKYQEFSDILLSRTMTKVKIKVPEFSPRSATFNVLTPVVNYKNSQNKLLSLPPSDDFYLQELNLPLSGGMQYLYYSGEFPLDESGLESYKNKTKEQLSEGLETFEANRPFLYFIMHEETKAILFWGTLNDPTKLKVKH